MKTVWIVLGSMAGAAAGSYLFMTYKGKKKCNCSGSTATTTPATPPASITPAPPPVSQPIPATAAVAMGMDGWKSYF